MLSFQMHFNIFFFLVLLGRYGLFACKKPVIVQFSIFFNVVPCFIQALDSQLAFSIFILIFILYFFPRLRLLVFKDTLHAYRKLKRNSMQVRILQFCIQYLSADTVD
jgi:hypothetical protein